jgi:putative nucleotidyltransferase with HDIG domain
VTTKVIDQIVARVDTLPTLPDTVHRLIAVVSNPDSTLQQIVDVIRYDQALTAEVLRLCNSAYFGLARSVETLDDAICLLGTVKVFQLVMTAHARGMLSRPQEGYGLPAGALWRHSVGVAITAQHLARKLRINQAGLLFTGGLLHDTGKVVLNEFVAEQYAEILRRVADDKVTFADAEEAVLGFTHPQIGGRLAEAWSLPESIRLCIAHHHDPEALPTPDPLVDAVHLADSVCLMLGIGTGDDGLAYRASPACMTRHGLTESDLESVGIEAIAELRTVQALFAKA